MARESFASQTIVETSIQSDLDRFGHSSLAAMRDTLSPIDATGTRSPDAGILAWVLAGNCRFSLHSCATAPDSHRFPPRVITADHGGNVSDDHSASVNVRGRDNGRSSHGPTGGTVVSMNRL
jgi:hypothetical protein